MSDQARNENEMVVWDKDQGRYKVLDLETGDIRYINNMAHTTKELELYKFDYHKARLICQLVAEGMTMTEVAETDGIPPLSVIRYWQAKDRMFAEELKIARMERADHHFEQVVGIANKAYKGEFEDAQAVANAKLAASEYKWLAEKGRPEKYSQKVVHEGSKDKPIVMRVINTGINRQPDVVVESKEVHNVEQERKQITERTNSDNSTTARDEDESGSGSIIEAECTDARSDAGNEQEDRGVRESSSTDSGDSERDSGTEA